MADDNRLLLAERRHQRDHVADVGRRGGPSEPAHIRRSDMEAGFRDSRDLVPPGIG
jgi:hypothetical protein